MIMETGSEDKISVMTAELQKISHRGRQRVVPSIPLGPNTAITIRGRAIRIGEVFDEFWIRSKDMLTLPEIVAKLRNRRGRPDILTSAQKLPDSTPRFPYRYEWDNLAVASFGSYSEWFDKQVARDARSQIRKAAKERVRTEIVPFSNDFVEGICSIYNELPVRQEENSGITARTGKPSGRENGTYLERSVFLGAYFEDELIGFLKMVMDDEVAALMQVLSKSAHFGKRPNNALLSTAVEICAQKGAKHLIYGNYVYGKKERSSLSEFKKSLGFKKVDIPRWTMSL